MEQRNFYPESLDKRKAHYCPGCTHGIAHRMMAEAIDEAGLHDSTVGVASVGCSVFSFQYFNTDFIQSPHGRAPAVATGVKRVRPECFVFTYQGDGDLAAIGTSEFIWAAQRGEKITIIFINNDIYGMTGGQLAPTTLEGWKTTTTPFGRDIESTGKPMRVSELVAQLSGTAFVARTSLHNPANAMKTKKAIKKAVDYQMQGLGFTMVEILSNCNTNWGMDPLTAMKRIENEMVPFYPLGVFKDVLADKEDQE
ncbi:2-oxoglutarate oxidoreductase [bacterium]|nr:2-oxoglutarate oxidoreductase [bacterium]MBU1025345.1 2-oxoglutarate oxidoreductase [bacterium]